MRELSLIASTFLLAMLLIGCESNEAESPDATLAPSLKGYEIYSWQESGNWAFALVAGTNRIKTFDEISSPKIRVQGLDALKGELDRLPGGEHVFWSAGRVRNTTLPPRKTMDQIGAYCRQRGIQLSIDQTGVPHLGSPSRTG